MFLRNVVTTTKLYDVIAQKITICKLSHTLKMRAAFSSETSENIYQTAHFRTHNLHKFFPAFFIRNRVPVIKPVASHYTPEIRIILANKYWTYTLKKDTAGSSESFLNIYQTTNLYSEDWDSMFIGKLVIIYQTTQLSSENGGSRFLRNVGSILICQTTDWISLLIWNVCTYMARRRDTQKPLLSQSLSLRRDLGPTQHPMQRVRIALAPGLKSSWQ
jgi:hypothetical protein